MLQAGVGAAGTPAGLGGAQAGRRTGGGGTGGKLADGTDVTGEASFGAGGGGSGVALACTGGVAAIGAAGTLGFACPNILRKKPFACGGAGGGAKRSGMVCTRVTGPEAMVGLGAGYWTAGSDAATAGFVFGKAVGLRLKRVLKNSSTPPMRSTRS